MRRPHVDGAFRQILVADAGQCSVVRPDVALSKAAFDEPLAAVLHGLGQAGPLIGRRVLVTGCGPIGNLAVLAARFAGAAEIVATDIVDEALGIAGRLGADQTVNVARQPDALDAFAPNKGRFDVRRLLSEVLPLAQAESAFRLATDRKRAMKVQINSSG